MENNKGTSHILLGGPTGANISSDGNLVWTPQLKGSNDHRSIFQGNRWKEIFVIKVVEHKFF